MPSGAKPGDIRTKSLFPIRSKEDPRYKKLEAGREKFQQAQRDAKERRRRYTEQLASLKAEQLDTVKKHIEDDDFVMSPADMLLTMLKEQQMIVANEKLTENQHHRERQLLLSMYKEYAALTGANAPTTQSLDITSEPIEVKSPEEIQAELLKMTAGLKTIS